MNDINELSDYIITTYDINDLEDLSRDMEDLVKAAETPPDYQLDMGRDALAPPKDDASASENELSDNVKIGINKLLGVLKDEKELIKLLRKKMKLSLPSDVEDATDLHEFVDTLGKGDLVRMQHHINELNEEHPEEEQLPDTSDDVKKATKYRSAGELEDDGKVRVECYPCKKKLTWTSYPNHLTSKIHVENASTYVSKGNGFYSIKNNLKKKKRVLRGRGLMDINKLKAAIKAIVN